MGSINIDPCGPSTYAENTLTYPEIDGLTADWSGHGTCKTAFINPPFGRSYLVGHQVWSAGDVRESCKGQLLEEGIAKGRNVDWRRDSQRLSKACREFVKGRKCQTVEDWAKAAIEAATKDGMQVCWISKAAVETPGLQLLLQASSAVCFPSRRVCYIDPATQKPLGGPTFPSIVIGLRVDPAKFRDAFKDMGTVLGGIFYAEC